LPKEVIAPYEPLEPELPTVVEELRAEPTYSQFIIPLNVIINRKHVLNYLKENAAFGVVGVSTLLSLYKPLASITEAKEMKEWLEWVTEQVAVVQTRINELISHITTFNTNAQLGDTIGYLADKRINSAFTTLVKVHNADVNISTYATADILPAFLQAGYKIEKKYGFISKVPFRNSAKLELLYNIELFDFMVAIDKTQLIKFLEETLGYVRVRTVGYTSRIISKNMFETLTPGDLIEKVDVVDIKPDISVSEKLGAFLPSAYNYDYIIDPDLAVPFVTTIERADYLQLRARKKIVDIKYELKQTSKLNVIGKHSPDGKVYTIFSEACGKKNPNQLKCIYGLTPDVLVDGHKAIAYRTWSMFPEKKLGYHRPIESDGHYAVAIVLVAGEMAPFLNLIKTDSEAADGLDWWGIKGENWLSNWHFSGGLLTIYQGEKKLTQIEQTITSGRWSSLNTIGRQFYIKKDVIYKDRYKVNELYADISVPPSGRYTLFNAPEKEKRIIKVRRALSNIPQGCRRILLRLRDGSLLELYTIGLNVNDKIAYDMLDTILSLEPESAKRWYLSNALTVELGRPAYNINTMLDIIRQIGSVRLFL
jgi:hypothetical protein